MYWANFFPSRTVAFYISRLFLARSFAVLAGLVLILQTLDMLGESGKILAYAGNGQPQLWYYISLRAPQIAATFLPFSVLLGTIITAVTLNQHSEVIAMKSSGLSAHQILAPLIVAALGVAVLSFVFNDRVVSDATATLNVWRRVEYGPLPVDRGDRVDVWVRDGTHLIEVAQIHGRGDAARLTGIKIYERDGPNLDSVLMADSGVRDAKGWKAINARRFDVTTLKLTPLGSVHFGEGVRPDQFTLADVDADGLSFLGLYDTIHELKAAGRPTSTLEGDLWHKLSSPLSCVLMPLLGAVAAFGLARSGKLVIRAVLGMMLGFFYFIADNFALAMGNMGAYPPFLAAWAPFLLFLMIGEAVLLRTEE